ncbi:SURF1 family protein [Leisingera sp. F5]|uniref:SURF1 family protein n=1 Tax=Leisingera sp. F5 TaxID=1813816 RepID=UPI000B1D99DC|nr:SURF1 family protein [Leisingera sp. F5]
MRRVIFLLIISGAGLAILIGLGTWQLQRKAWKEAILATIEARMAEETGVLPTEPDPETDRYWPVSAKGYVGNQYLRVLISNQAFGPSYRIVSAFEVDGRNVMLDRGVIPVDEEPPAGHPEKVEVTGNLHWPDEVDSYTPAPDLENNIWYARDVEAMAEALGTEPVLIVLREQTFYDTPVRPDPVSTSGIPNNHLQYAITWFSLAFIWAAMTVYFLRRSRPNPKS